MPLCQALGVQACTCYLSVFTMILSTAAKAMRDYSLTRATNHGLLSIGVYYDPTVSSSAIALSVSMLLNAAHAPPVVPTPALHAAGHQ